MAAAAGTILDKPNFVSPYPRTRFDYHPPIPDRGQLSYDDVNFELDRIRNDPKHKHSNIIFLGGDGLTYMRLIHRLQQDPQLFLNRTPIIIPQLGEHPHGTFHLMHGYWRVWWPLIQCMAAVVGNKQVVDDPGVSAFNKHEFFLRILIRAFAEYVVEIAATGLSYNNVAAFMAAADQNLMFALVVHFLFEFGFLYLQMRNSVRSNDSATLDKVWREFLSTARTKDSNKTNYAPMSVIRVYWGKALVEPLQTVYHNLRTLRMIHTHVGWDMPIEMLNKLIRDNGCATFESIESFLKYINFTSLVSRGLDEVFTNNKVQTEWYKDIDRTVAIIKEFLRTNIGTNFQQATRPSQDNTLGIDVAPWWGTRTDKIDDHLPWKVAAEQSKSNKAFVAEQLGKLCPWHKWQP